MDLNGKNVVYIGGFGGIGQKCLKEFLIKGIKNLAIFDLNENAAVLSDLQTSFTAANIFYIKLDITSKENIEAAYREAFAKLGRFDVIVNGCGLMDDRFIDLTIQINLLGVIHSTLTAMPYMDKSKNGYGGIILNISSVAGLEPSGMFAAYVAAKTGVIAFSRSLQKPILYAQTGIGFITVCPGLTETTLLDDIKEKTTFNTSPTAAVMAEHFKKIERQSPDICAKNLVRAVETARNGSVWILDMGEMKEVDFPIIWKPTLKS